MSCAGQIPLRRYGEDVELMFMNCCKSEFQDLVNKVRSNFRFEYVGGGYFRDKTVPKGIKADTVHGTEILAEFCSELIKQYDAK